MYSNNYKSHCIGILGPIFTISLLLIGVLLYLATLVGDNKGVMRGNMTLWILCVFEMFAVCRHDRVFSPPVTMSHLRASF